MSHHRADDLPPYLTIVIAGHLLVPLILSVEQAYQPSLLIQLALWLPLALGLTLGMLQPIKGGVVALQWAQRMHGFSGEPVEDHDPTYVDNETGTPIRRS